MPQRPPPGGTDSRRPPPAQHSSGTASTSLRAARVAGLVALGVALFTVPYAWGRSLVPTSDVEAATPANHVVPVSENWHDPLPSPSSSPTQDPAAAQPAPQATAPAPAAPAPAKPAPAKPAPAPAQPAPAPAAPAPAPPAPPPAAPQTSLTDQIVALTNAERAKGGLAPLAVNSCLTDQSNQRTSVLVAENRFEHDPLDPVIAACGMPHTIGENLILGYRDAASAVQGWMNSPGHRANIMNPAFTQIGVGCTLGPKGQLCGQLFLG